MGRECSTYGREEECIQDFSRKLEGTGTPGRPRHRWEDNIRMDFGEIG
jgi:hypothetical protein